MEKGKEKMYRIDKIDELNYNKTKFQHKLFAWLGRIFVDKIGNNGIANVAISLCFLYVLSSSLAFFVSSTVMLLLMTINVVLCVLTFILSYLHDYFCFYKLKKYQIMESENDLQRL